MRTLLRALHRALAFLMILAVGAFFAAYWYVSHPTLEQNPLAPGLVAAESPEGKSFEGAALKADLDGLRAAMQSQEKRSWCGVASGATALSALRHQTLSQPELLRQATSVRGWLRTTFMGMPLDALAAILVANGAQAQATHAADVDVQTFRAALDRNMADDGDALLVNFDRTGLGQSGSGHISPVGAWDRGSDRVLVLDVATLRYPPVWVDADTLFDAMRGIDGESGTSRGWVEVRQ